MHRIGFRLTVAAVMAVAVGAWYHQGQEAKAAPAAADAAVQMELVGLTVPDTSRDATSTQAAASSVLSPSCEADVPGACDRLQTICADLQGEMTDNLDGTLTCRIVLD